jgi:pimeloyl-ACP methyl ester carboxylesterase
MSRFFENDGFRLAYHDTGKGSPVLLIHGFASNVQVNWIAPGWVEALTDAGYRVIAIDNRGHGASAVSHDPEAYRPEHMADDAAALLDHLNIEQAHVIGYSMGARIAAFLALRHPHRVATLVFGGLGIGIVDGAGGDWSAIAAALVARDPAEIDDPRALRFRQFAEATRSDRRALAACIETSREELSEDEIRWITQPALVAVGTEDDIAGDPEPLAALLPNGESFAIEGRDHMLSVGDRRFKQRVIEFLAEHPIE